MKNRFSSAYGVSPSAFVFLVLVSVSSALPASAQSGLRRAPVLRGDLERVEKEASHTRKSLDLAKNVFEMTELMPTPFAVDLYRFTYWTAPAPKPGQGAAGPLVLASAMMALPKMDQARIDPAANPAEGTVRGFISYQHGTLIRRSTAPSRVHMIPEVMATSAVFASMGWILVASDYLGLGESTTYHPYLHAESEATAAYDSLIAAQKALARLKSEAQLDLNVESKQLYLVGYSQGGHATLALHQYIEKQDIEKQADGAPVLDLELKGSVPMAGPLDLSETSLSLGLLQKGRESVAYVAYLIFAYQKAYGIFPDLTQVIQAPYAAELDQIFDGTLDMSEVLLRLPERPQDLLTTSFMKGLSDGADPLASTFIAKLKENDVYRFVPRAPVYLIHARGDQHVPFENSMRAFREFEKAGADVEIRVLGPELGHDSGSVPSFLEAYRWINSKKGL